MKDPAVRETWAKRVERWKESGLSAKDFGAEVGVNPRSLSWWRWELAKGDAAASAERPRRRRSRNTRAIAKTAAVSALTFVEVTAGVVSTPLEVVLPSTLRVRVPIGVDDATLGRLLDVLEARR